MTDFYSGLDMYSPPPGEQLQWIKMAGFSWCGMYLGPAPSHQDEGWMSALPALQNVGLGALPIYVGQQVVGPGSQTVTEDQGRRDGQQAGALMKNAMFTPGSFVYLDLENGPPYTEAQQGYVAAWAQAVSETGYGVGVYCSHTFGQEVLAQAGAGARLWCFKVATTAVHQVEPPYAPGQDPAGCGVPSAVAWQYEQNAEIDLSTYGGASSLVCDLSYSTLSDPSAP